MFVSKDFDLNTFATGILPFSKTILIGKDIHTKLNSDEIDALVAHEVAHLKHNHLLKAFGIQVLIVTVATFVWSQIAPFLIHLSYYFFLIFVYNSVFSILGSLFLMGLYQKKMEKEADAFAAKNISSDAVISLLNTLNSESKGVMEKWSWNYPTLKQRIENVS